MKVGGEEGGEREEWKCREQEQTAPMPAEAARQHAMLVNFAHLIKGIFMVRYLHMTLNT